MNLDKEKILKRLDKYKTIQGECWIWTATKSGGYGYIRLDGRLYKVSRIICSIYHNLDLNDQTKHALHKLECTNPACFNPAHLYVGNRKDNMKDWSKSITHCPRGHEYTKDNTAIYWRKDRQGYGKRCRTCRREMQRVK